MTRRSSSDGKLVSRSESISRPKPSLRISDSELPAIKDWEVGKKYKVHATVEMRSHSQGDEWGDGNSKKHSAVLVVHKIEAHQKSDGSDSK